MHTATPEPQGSPRLIEYARRASCQDAMRTALQIQTVANELRNMFDGRILPLAAGMLLSGVIADLESEAKKLMDSVTP